MAPEPREASWKLPLTGYSSEWKTYGAIDVRIAGVRITTVPIIDSKMNVTESKVPFLVIVVEVRKNTPNKNKVLYSWQRYISNVVVASDPAVLLLPNDKALAPGRLRGGKLNVDIPETQKLSDDGTAVRNVLLFAAPVDDAGKLRLRLDGERFSESTDVWLEIPALSWKPK